MYIVGGETFYTLNKKKKKKVHMLLDCQFVSSWYQSLGIKPFISSTKGT
jgi:hypothetical protein